MKKFFISIALLVSLFVMPSCSPQTSEIVCDYGSVLCDVSGTLCQTIPGMPPQVCEYLDLACYNLDRLCQLQDSTDSINYEIAKTNLQNVTIKLRQWSIENTKK